MACDLLAAVELAVIIGCGVIAKVVYIDGFTGHQPAIGPYLNVSVMGAVFSYFSLKKRRLYDESKLAETRGLIQNIVAGLAIAFLLLIAVGYLAKDAHTYSRGWFLLWFGTSLLSLLLVRGVGRMAVGRLLQRGYFRRRVAIVGTGLLGERLHDYLCSQEDSVDTVGIFGDWMQAETSSDDEHGTIRGLQDLIFYARTNPVDCVIIALPSDDEDRIMDVVTRLSQLPCQIDLCPNLIGLKVPSPRIDHLARLGLLELQPKPIEDWARVSKAVLDYAGSALILTAMAPLLALVALAIKLESRGPVFFRQRRHGFNHEVIHVIKFRTMTVMEDGPEFRQATANDRRVTRVGWFLRRTSLDELPQFWNVLRGEMSIVGPRPHALAHNEQFFLRFQDYANRHKVKPGITGWAQVNGSRGETDTPERMRRRVNYDLEYINNWSIWSDLRIILRTVFTVLRCENAH